MRRLLTVLFCLWPLLAIFGNVENIEPQEVATTEGLPSSLVNQTVCAISGEYTDHVVDVILPGPEPLVISRVYNSFSAGKPWTFNHYEKLIVDYGRYEDKPVDHVRLRQPTGAQLDYIFEKKSNYKKLKKLDFKLITPKGLTNGAVMLSGRTNIKNQALRYYPEEETIETISGAGSRKVFKEIVVEDGKPVFGQISETKANGNNYKYEGKSKGISGVTKIICRNKSESTEFSHVTFHEAPFEKEKDKRVQTLFTSDHREFKYYF